MTAAPSSTRKLTPEEFYELEDAAGYELIDGELKERPVSFRSSETAMNIGGLLRDVVRPQRLGRLLGPDIGLQIFPNRPRLIRKPDLAFVAESRMTPEVEASGYLRIPPDLVVEVISPGDKAADVQEKVDLYLGAGVRLVWVAYPDTRKVIVYRADGSTTIYGPEAEITGEDVVAGFAARVADLFPGHTKAPEAAQEGGDASS